MYVTMTLANAVGAATAMKAGAGRNVADVDRVVAILQKAEEWLPEGEGRQQRCGLKREALQRLMQWTRQSQ